MRCGPQQMSIYLMLLIGSMTKVCEFAIRKTIMVIQVITVHICMIIEAFSLQLACIVYENAIK